jgi:phosphate-selective porin OprO and OprP
MTRGSSRLTRNLCFSVCSFGLLTGAISEAKAQDLQQIQAQIQEMQATIQALQKQVADAKAQAAAANATAATAGKSDLDLKVKWKGAPELSSADGKFKMKVRGRVEVDYNKANQDTRITSFPDVAGTELRRARLGIEGVLYYDWKYILEVDFANDAVRIRDAYLDYQGFKIGDDPLIFRVGNFKTFNTFEEENSANYLDSMERAAFIPAWNIDRQIGFGTMYYTDKFGLAAGVFGQRFPSEQDNPLFAGFTGDEDLTFGARAYAAPINRETNGLPQVLHFGASVRTRQAGDDQQLFAYGNETGQTARAAELRLTNAPVVTGRIGEEDTFWGLEAAALWGPLSLQGEYAQLEVELPTGPFVRGNPPFAPGQLARIANPFVGDPDPTFNGWYVEATWFFGGHKTYDTGGKWGRPKIYNPMFHGSGGWGALQLVGKYDVLDQSDTAFNNAGGCRNTTLYPGLSASAAGAPPALAANSIPLCGEMNTWVAGVNWWMTEYVRLMFQYSESALSNYPIFVAQNPALPPGTNNGFDGAHIRGFGMRMHVDW